jgi:5-methylcytosine-specific restriction endonuclease McrA
LKKSKKNYEANKEHVLANCKKYRESNKEKISDYHKAYRKKYKDEIKLKRQIRYKNNPEKYSAMRRKYNLAHKEEIQEMCQRWWEKNEGLKVIYSQRYRSRKNNLKTTLTLEQWEQIKKDFDNKCAYCGKEPDGTLEQDHFIALANDGEYTHDNIIPACKSCNASKANRDFFKWYPRQDYYSKTREKKILKYLNYTENGEQQLTIAI